MSNMDDFKKDAEMREMIARLDLPRLTGLGPCARCGKNPAEGFAKIGGDWYCQPDFGPSCYMRASFLSPGFSNTSVTQTPENSAKNTKTPEGASNADGTQIFLVTIKEAKLHV